MHRNLPAGGKLCYTKVRSSWITNLRHLSFKGAFVSMGCAAVTVCQNPSKLGTWIVSLTNRRFIGLSVQGMKVRNSSSCSFEIRHFFRRNGAQEHQSDCDIWGGNWATGTYQNARSTHDHPFPDLGLPGTETVSNSRTRKRKMVQCYTWRDHNQLFLVSIPPIIWSYLVPNIWRIGPDKPSTNRALVFDDAGRYKGPLVCFATGSKRY
jgi:hypothetical protein